MKKKDKKIFTIVIDGKREITAQGYSFLPLPKFFLVDEIHVYCTEKDLPIGKMTVFYLKTYGCQETEESPIEMTMTRHRCNKCKKPYDEKPDRCPNCKCDSFYTFTIKSTKIILEKHGSLQAHHEELVRDEDNKDVLKLIEIKDFQKKFEDGMIIRGWRTCDQK